MRGRPFTVLPVRYSDQCRTRWIGGKAVEMASAIVFGAILLLLILLFIGTLVIHGAYSLKRIRARRNEYRPNDVAEKPRSDVLAVLFCFIQVFVFWGLLLGLDTDSASIVAVVGLVWLLALGASAFDFFEYKKDRYLRAHRADVSAE